MFRIEMLPAEYGDCLWIEYGDEDKPYRILIDGGTEPSYTSLCERIKALNVNDRKFELLVITHIDADHIGGVLKVMDDEKCSKASFGDIRFNGYRHLPESQLEEFGPVQGEKLTTALIDQQLPWNEAFAKKAVTNLQPSVTLPGGMKLTLISPTVEELKKLKPVWIEECRKAGIDPAMPSPTTHEVPPGLEGMGPIDVEALSMKPFKIDASEANGSSIALLAEYDGRTALLAGDAHPDVLLKGIESVCKSRQVDKLKLDAFKLPHHGSKANINKELLEKLKCKRYLISTNGAKFRHPDKEAVARVIKFGGTYTELIFNYRTEFNEVWRDANLMEQYRYRVSYPNKTGTLIGLS
jgi:beta-lactamase superfamily II metal-dependent hydrolase